MKVIALIKRHFINEISQFTKTELTILMLVLTFLVCSRLSLIQYFPAALTHDELVYAAQAKAMAITGKTIDQAHYSWSLQPLHPMYAELPGVLMIPFFKVFSNPLIATRALSLLFGILFPFVLSGFFYEWFVSKRIAYASLLLASVNPLLWQMSRLMYDAPYSVIFYLLGGIIFLRAKSKSMIAFSFLAMILGFLGYQGYKLLFLPWIALLIWKKSQGTLKKVNKLDWFFGITCLSVFAFYSFFMLPNQIIENRFNSTIFANNDYLSSQVNEERRLSLQNPFVKVFSNKFTIAVKFTVDKFINAFNSNTLFWTGEPAQSKFAVWGHGWFYVIDFLLIIFGLISMGYNKKYCKSGIALLCFIAFSTLPSLVNSGNSWYLLRMFFPNILLLGILSLGIILVAKSRLLLMAFASVYMLSVIYFGYYYYYRYPILGQNTGYVSERVIVDYINRVRRTDVNTPIYVHTVDVPVMLWSYIIYSDFYTKETAREIAQFSGKDDVHINNIIFTTKCADPTQSGIVVNEAWRIPCDHVDKTKLVSLSIPSIVDNGTYWNIYNDFMCGDFANRPFIAVNSISDFDLERQSNEKFCNQWLAKFN